MKYLLIALLFLLSACSIKNYEITTPKILTLKTQKIKFSDIAYLRHTDDSIELELFIAGHVFKRIHINHLICIDDEGCMRKSSFNTEYLNAAYPETLLQNVLLGRKIYNGEAVLKKPDGFKQNIQTKELSIEYVVNSHQIYFKDKKNHILIKIKELK
ncbi:hypothetical protein [Sulfurimonas sp.]|uniref:hypothetical protein n=1 Tax=Sulfurimonas sp. TaxID=2022749 RepID=UPI00261B01DC|nr:hypothetical protein [Sulfurimonas sp.]